MKIMLFQAALCSITQRDTATAIKQVTYFPRNLYSLIILYP